MVRRAGALPGVLLLLSVACSSTAGNGPGEPPADTVTGTDVRLAQDHGTSDLMPTELLGPPTEGPRVHEITRLPLTEYGPAFWMEGEVVEDGLLEVIVRTRSLSKLVGFAALITWDPSLLELVEAAATAPIGGVDAVAKGVAAGQGPGRLTLGVTRFPKAPDPWNPKPLGVDIPGEVEMGRFLLRPLAAGDGTLRFHEARRVARRPDYSEIPCAWAGLQLRIVREDLP